MREAFIPRIATIRQYVRWRIDLYSSCHYALVGTMAPWRNLGNLPYPDHHTTSILIHDAHYYLHQHGIRYALIFQFKMIVKHLPVGLLFTLIRFS